MVRQERFRKLRKRLHRFAALSTGSSHAPAAVFRAGGVASTIHGVEVTGLADSSLAKLRRMAGQVLFTSAAGRSLTASFLLSPQSWDDPMFDATLAPMLAWSAAVWAATAEEDIQDMRLAFSRALTKVARALNPFACAIGPAVATVATLRRIGWTATSYRLWYDNHRNPIDLREVGGHTLRRRIELGVRIWQKCQLARTGGSSHAPPPGEVRTIFVDPIKQLLSLAEKRLTAAQKGQLRAIYVDSLWTQGRLAAHGLVLSAICRLCGIEDGTLRHRHWRCDGTGSRRYVAGMREISIVAGQSNEEDPFWTHLWAVDPAHEAPPPLRNTLDNAKWLVYPPHGVFTGEAYIDGSVFDPTLAELARAGYAVVQLAVEGSSHAPWPEGFEGASAVLYGPYGGLVQDIGAAGIYAAVMAVRHGLPPLVLYTDCQLLVDGYNCTAGGSSGACILGGHMSRSGLSSGA